MFMLQSSPVDYGGGACIHDKPAQLSATLKADTLGETLSCSRSAGSTSRRADAPKGAVLT
jgi:hypothetical protein